LFENDFSNNEWLKAKKLPPSADDLVSISEGRLTIQAPAPPEGNFIYYYSIVPWTDSADIEIVGHSTLGSWGFYLVTNQHPLDGMMFALDQQGRIRAWRSAQISPRSNTRFGEISVAMKNISWQNGASFNVLRALVKDQQVKLWINGAEACDPIKVPDSMPLMAITLAGQNSDQGMSCEFDSARVWRAGEGPPLLPLPTEQPASNLPAAPKGLTPSLRHEFFIATNRCFATWLDSTRSGTLNFPANSTERICSTFDPKLDISSISSNVIRVNRRASGTMRGSVV
jgi:hypothetical protein